MSDSFDDYRWLVGPHAAAWLELCSASADSLVKQTSQLRRELSAERTHLVLEQIALRRRAREKFVQADEMFFTAVGLEQATDQWVAAYKATRFPTGKSVFDLCCGIGGDLGAIAERCTAKGVDRDPVSALFANVNAPTASVIEADVSGVDVSAAAAWHIDPDRRPGGQRTTRVEDHEPGLDTLERLLAARQEGAIKLAPAAQWPEAWNERAELEWISRGGECRQLVAWFGNLAAHGGQRAATIVSKQSQPPRTIVGPPSIDVPIATQPGRYIFEPDAAVLAADLTGVLAGEHRLERISAGIAYLTGDQLIDDPALACFETLDVLPFDLRQLKAHLRARGIGRLEVKKRGVEIEPAQVRRQLTVPGEESATLIITPHADAVIAILARRCAKALDR